MLIILTNRHPSEIYKLISEGKDYYNNISNLIHIITYLIFYLSKNPSNFFLLLSQGTQTTIEDTCQKDDLCMLYGWFIHENLTDYCKVIFNYMNTNFSFIIESVDWRSIFLFSDSSEWETQVNQLMAFYYCSSPSNDIAFERFNSTISPFFNEFDTQEKIEFLLKNIELSYQLCNKENL